MRCPLKIAVYAVKYLVSSEFSLETSFINQILTSMCGFATTKNGRLLVDFLPQGNS